MSLPFSHAEPLREISDVNIVPLADVSLVLLIILLLLSPMMTQSMLQVKTAGRPARAPAELSSAPPAPQDAEPVLSVSLTPEGLQAGGRRFAGPGELRQFLQAELARRAERKVFLTPHLDVPHGQVLHTLELIKSCGAESVALVQTEDPSDNGPIPPAQAPAEPN
ncbi:MAG: biopolymer transporter ExbD [Elusimicrobia bacterium]|nr:biopolymer transporter ExbD [Elusimicrobiota bacterium]